MRAKEEREARQAESQAKRIRVTVGLGGGGLGGKRYKGTLAEESLMRDEGYLIRACAVLRQPDASLRSTNKQSPRQRQTRRMYERAALCKVSDTQTRGGSARHS